MTNSVTNNAFVKIAAAVAGIAMVASMAFAFVPSARAATPDLQAQIASLMAQIQTLNSQLNAVQGGTTSSTGNTGTVSTNNSSACNFTMSLTIGSKGADVVCLQDYLTAGGYFTYSGGSTGYFGSVTKKAVAAWQAANNVAPAVGYFGPISRAEYTTLTAVTATNTNTNTTGNTGTTGTTGNTGTTGTVATGNGLQVTLGANSPSGTAIVMKQGIANLAEFTFTNPTSSAVAVNSLTFKRTGISNDSTMTNVYLYNGVTPITDSAGITNSQFTFNNPAGIFTVPAGGSYTVAVRSDIADNTSGQQIGVELTAVSSNGTLDSSVSFPIRGGLQAISSATLATVVFSASANTLPVPNLNVNPTSDYVVWQNSVSVSTNPVKLYSLTFTNLGSVSSNALQNIRLYVDGTQVGNSLSNLGTSRTMTFNLSASPVTLSTSNHIIKVVANVVGGSSRTFQFSLQRTSSSMFVDTQLKQPVVPTVSGSTNFSAVSAGLQTVTSVGASSGVSVNKAASSPSNDIPVGATNVKVASFDLLASGEAVKISDLNVFAITTPNAGGLSNGKLMVNGVQIGSTKNIGETSANATDFNLGSSLIIPAGKTVTVDVYADAKTSTSTNIADTGTIKVVLKGSTSNAQGQSSLNATNVPTSDKPATSMTVSKATIGVASFSGYGNQAMLPGANNALLGSFVLSAGSTEGVNVNTVALDLAGNGGVTNLTLKDHATGTRIGSSITTPSGTGNTFSTNFVIPASGTKVVDVYGNISSSAGTNIIAKVQTATSGTGMVTNNSVSVTSAVSLQTITVGSGSISVALGASNPSNTIVIAGSAGVPVADYKFTALNTPYTVQKLQISVPTASAVTNVNLSYPTKTGTATATAYLTASSTNANAGVAIFSNLTMYVPQNDTADLSISVGTPTISSGSVSGAKISTTLMPAGFQATDSAGNQTTTITSQSSVNGSYGQMVLRKSVPTFAGLSFASTITPVGQDLYKFTITAGASQASVDTLSFKVATTTLTATGFTLYDVTNGSATVIGSSVSAPTGIASFNLGTSPIEVGAGSTKTFTIRANTITGWGTGASISVNLNAADATASSANGYATGSGAITGNYVWSDNSAVPHTTLTPDWTNGYLLKNMIDGTYSYTHS